MAQPRVDFSISRDREGGGLPLCTTELQRGTRSNRPLKDKLPVGGPSIKPLQVAPIMALLRACYVAKAGPPLILSERVYIRRHVARVAPPPQDWLRKP